MIITNSRYALVGYFITSYPTRAHGIIVIYFPVSIDLKRHKVNFDRTRTDAVEHEPMSKYFHGFYEFLLTIRYM